MKTTVASLLVFIFICAAFKADTHFIENIAQKLEDYTQQYPQEKLYLHTDKPFYSVNDTLYFKAYLTHAENNLPDSVSKVLYVDILNKISGETVVHKVFKAENGYAQGDLFLKDTLAAGLYHLRAYTAWMRNFSDDFFFEKTFRLYNTDNKMASYDQSKLRALAKVADFQFLPEGGYLVAGLNNRLAFKATNTLGKSVDTEGFIVQNKDTVLYFGAMHKGMGYVSFMPENGKNYQAFIKDQDGDISPVTLPQIQSKGYAMTVDNLSNKENIKVYISQNQSNQAENMGLIAQQNGKVCASMPLKIGAKKLMVLVPRSSIAHNGLVQLTLFDDKNQPLAERLIYENKDKHLNISIESNKKIYQNREKIELSLQINDHEGKPVMGEFSLTATDAKQVIEEANAENILSYQYLSSDLNTGELKGQIEEPAYYFDPKNESAKAHLDLLLMTQGWRRFDWKNVVEPQKKDLAFLPENGLSITGKALRPNGKATEKGMNVTLFVKKAKNPMMMALADESGKFRFEGMEFNDTSEVVVQAVRGKNIHAASISLDTWTKPKFKIIQVPFNPIEINQTDYQDFIRKSQEMYAFEKELRFQNQLLNQVNVKGKKEEKHPYDPKRPYGAANARQTVVFTKEMVDGFSNVFDLLQLKVPNGIGGFFMIDGMPVDIAFINTLNIRDIALVDIIADASIGMYSAGLNRKGANFITKSGLNASAGYSEKEGFIIKSILGYTTPKVFYHPKYDIAEMKNRPDYRSTLYWNPSIKTDINGKASMSFWASDNKGGININVEGNTPKGEVGLGKATILIK